MKWPNVNGLKAMLTKFITVKPTILILSLKELILTVKNAFAK